MQKKTIMILAGENSGDMYAAGMIQELNQLNTGLHFNGMGSTHMRNAGAELIFDSKNIGVMGLIEVLKHWPEISKALKIIEKALRDNPPDLLVLIDYVEFNLRMAAIAKEIGVKVLFYVSPQIWAWRPERIHKIGTLVDMMAVLFPFEVKYYEDANIPVRYVGHPLASRAKANIQPADFRKEFTISNDKKIIGILPGSRSHEITQILPRLLQCAQQLNEKRDDLVFCVPIAPSLDKKLVNKITQRYFVENCILLEGRSYDVMQASHSVMIASGTATLETALIGTPMAIVYQVSKLSWFWMKKKINIANVGLANIVAGKRIVPEFIQNEFTIKNVCTEIEKQLTNGEYYQQIKNDLQAVKSEFGDENCSKNVAQLALEILD